MVQPEWMCSIEGAMRSVGPLIECADSSACGDCAACTCVCPAQAIERSDGRVSIDRARCVACGRCVLDCSEGKFAARSDMARLRGLLAAEVPVVALLASEFVAALFPRTPAEVQRLLFATGFSAVETTLLGEEMVAEAYEQAHSRSTSGSAPRLRSTCVVANEWVRRFYPQLTDALAPIVPPYVAQARLIRELYTQDVVVVYVSPCWARKDEILDPVLSDAVDLAIGFDELRVLLDDAASSWREGESYSMAPARLARQLSGVDGFPKQVYEGLMTSADDIVKVHDLGELDRLLGAVLRGETAPGFIDMLACDGCLDGPCVNPGESVYAKRNIEVAARELRPSSVVDMREFLGVMPAVDLGRRFRPAPAPPAPISPTPPVADEASHPAEKTLTRSDPATGLPGPEVLEQVLAREFSRAARHGSPLALLIAQVDGATPENGAEARPLHAVSIALGNLLRTSLRVSDLAVGLGGGRVAVLLPQTSKTEAWAVAEKLRLAVGKLSIESCGGCAAGGTLSVGVATQSVTMESPGDLLGAAADALARAQEQGSDRVHLSAG